MRPWSDSGSNLKVPAVPTATDRSPVEWAWAEHAGRPCDDISTGTCRKPPMPFYIHVLLLVKGLRQAGLS